jgi:hypothetical protein
MVAKIFSVSAGMFGAKLGMGEPSSASLRMVTIWLPVKRDVFMLNFQ